jgi:hypothetical protein
MGQNALQSSITDQQADGLLADSSTEHMYLGTC